MYNQYTVPDLFCFTTLFTRFYSYLTLLFDKFIYKRNVLLLSVDIWDEMLEEEYDGKFTLHFARRRNLV